MENTTDDNIEHPATEKMLQLSAEGSSSAVVDLHSSPKDKMIEGSSTKEITSVADLKPNSYDKVIEVRVYRKWVSATYSKKGSIGSPGKKTENAFCCILIDKQVPKYHIIK